MSGARQVLDAVLDTGSFLDWGPQVQPWHPDTPSYAAELASARTRAGTEEAVVVGEGRLDGRPVAVIVGEYAFLAGSIGLHAARLITHCITQATARGLPLLAAPASSGTRMQEGTPAFVQMATVAAALAAHRRCGLAYLVWLRNPTLGGVFASWGSLGQITAAQPRALIGFLGPRVYEALHDAPFPPGVQTAENLRAHGLLDAVLPLSAVRGSAVRALDVLCGPSRCSTATPVAAVFTDEPGALADETAPVWESVQRTRRRDRPGVREILALGAVDIVELSGTGRGGTGPQVVLALARIGDAPCVLVGQDRHAQGDGAELGVAALRVSRRGMAVAEELRLPLITLVDTAGAELSAAAEEQGIAQQIASCLYDAASLTVPTLAVLLGQGSGGAALALANADRVIAARHAWLSPLPPEGASAILHRTAERAAELAQRQGIGSLALRAERIVDVVVDERPDAADEPGAFADRLLRAMRAELDALNAMGTAQRLAHRTRPR